MIKFIRKFWLVVLLSSIASVLLVIKLSQKPELIPTIKEISPSPGSRLKNLDQIQIVFDSSVENFKNQLEIVVIPQLEITKEVKDNTFIITPTTPVQANNYIFELYFEKKQLYSWSYFILSISPPSTITSPPVSPTPKIITPSPSPKTTPLPTGVKEIGDPEVVEEVLKDTAAKYPLIKYMPFSNEDFAINYLAPLRLGVKIKGTDREKIKQDVLQWIRDKGVDPVTHEIVWLD